MAELNPLDLSRLLSELVGTEVRLAPGSGVADAKAPQVFGTYTVLPDDAALVLQADLKLLSSIGGALLRLPAEAVEDHVTGAGVDEVLRDAMHEVLNIASTAVVRKGRAVFQKMLFDASELPGKAAETLESPFTRSVFEVFVQDYKGGKLTIYTPFLV
jgi:hypothetical protein